MAMLVERQAHGMSGKSCCGSELSVAWVGIATAGNSCDYASGKVDFAGAAIVYIGEVERGSGGVHKRLLSSAVADTQPLADRVEFALSG